MIWNKKKECMSRDELMDLQGKKLTAQVKYMYQNAAYYREKMQAVGIEPGDIRGIEDLDKLPYTTKNDIKNISAYKELAGLLNRNEQVQRILDASKGKEWEEDCSPNDIRLRAECIARFLSMAGLNKNDIIQMTYSGDMADGKQGMKHAIEKIGAKVVGFSSCCHPKEFVSTMEKSGITSIMCTPTYLMRVAQTAKDIGYGGTCLKSFICSGESFSESTRRDIENILGGKIYDTYSLNGASGFGVAGECEYQNGMHIQEDFFLVEVYCENGTKILSGKEQGELVLTTLEEGRCPLIRYRTEDIVSLNREKCECGRTTIRMTRIESRNNDLIMIRGKEVLRVQIEEALVGIGDTEIGYTVPIDREHDIDVVDVIVESCSYSKVVRQGPEDIENKIEKALNSILGLIPRVSIVDRKVVNRFERGKVTVLDQRSFA